MDTDRPGEPLRAGDVFEGDVLPKLGNGCLAPGTTADGLQIAIGADMGETGLDLLSALPRYSAIFS